MLVIYFIVAALVGLQLVYPALTIGLSRLWARRPLHLPKGDKKYDYACIITAYKNAEIARPLVTSLLQQTHEQYQVYLVADECERVDFSTIDDPRFSLLIPEAPLRLKVKSIRYAMDRLVRRHDYIAVFDADNLAHPYFLETVNRFANAGYQCIQGQRTAKNLDTTYAALDSLGEFYKNYIERYVPFRLGGSAVISGSGMATAHDLYLAYLDSPEIQNGQHHGKRMLQEDKILQNFLLRRDVRIAYAADAVVYDEKVSSGEAVTTQRSRWLFSYFQNVPNSARLLLRGIVRLSWNQVYFALVTLALPMFIQLAAAAALAFAALFFAPLVTLAFCGAVVVFAVTVIWSLHLSDAPPSVLQAVWQAPKFIIRQVVALFKMGNPQRNFKHTEHNRYVQVEDVLKR